jgi:hypothetical protein
MSRGERRSAGGRSKAELRQGLTPEQLDALHTLEQFGWTLEFVRRPLFQIPVPVVFDRRRERFVVLEPDGSLNENPGFHIRR